jgi:nucleotide-binding universal stress UspA family protein
MILLNSVLVATDFGDTSTSALDYGRNLARAFGAKLHVLHVAARVAPMSAAEFDATNIADLQTDIVEEANRQLNLLLTDIDRKQLQAKAMVLASTSPAAAIVDYAKETHVDIIVVGTHGRGGISHLLMGSVAEHVVRNAPCPVLVVRPNEHEFILPDPVSVSTRI